MSKPLTPMMQQYMELKKQYSDCILLFRLGDFYEMFFEDALTASRELEITLTGRDCGQKERAPMCGVPHHSAEGYINKLIEKGYKVAIGEQVEDPKEVKGIVKRDVVRVVTPGTNLNTGSLEADRNNFLMSVYRNIANYGISYVDITTGAFYTTQVSGKNKVLDEIAKVGPKEIIINENMAEETGIREELVQRFNAAVSVEGPGLFDKELAAKRIMDQFAILSLEGIGVKDYPEAVVAAGALIAYVSDTQKSRLGHLDSIQYYAASDYMHLDMGTRRNLELVETIRDKQKRGSLLWVLDKTKTAMGGRMLRRMVEQPLTDLEAINARLDAVEEMASDGLSRAEAREYLAPVYDIERLMGKISCKTANARDLLSFKQSIAMIAPIKGLMSSFKSSLAGEIEQGLDTLDDLIALIESSINEEPPLGLREGGIIKEGYNEEVDQLRSASKDGKNWLANLEMQEREATGIKNLKIKYNKVFGYHIEVTNSYQNLVPEHYTRKQTMANAERYITPELKEMENKILGAEEKVIALEYELFSEIREMLNSHTARVKSSAMNLSMLDALLSLAETASKSGYQRPNLNEEGKIDIKDGRHPVVERMLDYDAFIANDTYLDVDSHRFSIITGPNMAGKSTYMRQVALICLMAQIGSFVPAETADICISDRIFTRVGASDDLASGQSTFMVEMTEVANILRYATGKSLVILDEIGRGTSTFDGLSIAWAVVEHIASKTHIGAKTLFATHYHELTELEGTVEGVQNYCITVKEAKEDLIFLRKIVPGGADKSYGIQVARLAGVPRNVIQRARILLDELTEADITKNAERNYPDSSYETFEDEQLNLFDNRTHPAVERLKAVDINSMTPIDALNLLAELVKEI